MQTQSVLVAIISVFVLLSGGLISDTPCDKILPGSANQGGYQFYYKSCTWDGDKEQYRRSYYVENKRNSSVPILWKDDNETYIKTILPPCPAVPCLGAEVIKSGYPFLQGKSIIKYGYNFDEYKEEPGVYKKNRDLSLKLLYGAKDAREFAKLNTVFRGNFSDGKNSTKYVHIEVTSFVENVVNDPYYRYKVIYQISNNTNDDLTLFRKSEKKLTFKPVWGLEWGGLFDSAIAIGGIPGIIKAKGEKETSLIFSMYLAEPPVTADTDLRLLSGDIEIARTSAETYIRKPRQVASVSR